MTGFCEVRVGKVGHAEYSKQVRTCASAIYLTKIRWFVGGIFESICCLLCFGAKRAQCALLFWGIYDEMVEGL